MPGFDEKILALYAKGMTTRDIQEIVQGVVRRGGLGHADLGNHRRPGRRGHRLADAAASKPVWPIVYFDGLVMHVRGANGHVSQHTIYVAIGVNLEGHKELLGLWLGRERRGQVLAVRA